MNIFICFSGNIHLKDECASTICDDAVVNRIIKGEKEEEMILWLPLQLSQRLISFS